ncbi:hypothetical protein D3C76_1643990 [compost metagenome]
MKCVQLSFDGLKVSAEQIIEQAALFWTDLFAALGVLMTFEDSDLMNELLDDDLAGAHVRWRARLYRCESFDETANEARATIGIDSGPGHRERLLFERNFNTRQRWL